MRTVPSAASLSAAVMVLTALSPPPPAHADDRAEAESYFRRAGALYEDGRYQEAAKMYQVCVALTPDLAGPHRRLGQSYKALGRCDDAVRHFLKYLALKPSGKYADEIRRDMERCVVEAGIDEEGDEDPRTGQVRLAVTPDGARVVFDGEQLGRSPLGAVAMSPGRHQAVVVKAGYAPWQGEVTVRAGEVVELSVALEETAGGRALSTGRLSLLIDPPGARVTVDGRLVGVSPLPDLNLPAGRRSLRIERPGYLGEAHEVEIPDGGEVELAVTLVHVGRGPLPAIGQALDAGPPQPADAPWLTRRRGGWVLIVVGAVTALAGVVTGVAALRKSNAYSKADESTDRRALKRSGETLALATDVSFVVAGLSAAGGGALLWSAGASPPPPAAGPDLEDVLEASTPAPSPAPALAFGGTF